MINIVIATGRSEVENGQTATYLGMRSNRELCWWQPISCGFARALRVPDATTVERVGRMTSSILLGVNLRAKQELLRRNGIEKEKRKLNFTCANFPKCRWLLYVVESSVDRGVEGWDGGFRRFQELASSMTRTSRLGCRTDGR